jgi:homoserine kinase type II
MDVYVVHHVDDRDDDEDVKLIGIYSTEDDARAAIARLVMQPGFRDVPNGFQVNRHTVGEDNWTEGFKIVDE